MRYLLNVVIVVVIVVFGFVIVVVVVAVVVGVVVVVIVDEILTTSAVPLARVLGRDMGKCCTAGLQEDRLTPCTISVKSAMQILCMALERHSANEEEQRLLRAFKAKCAAVRAQAFVPTSLASAKSLAPTSDRQAPLGTCFPALKLQYERFRLLLPVATQNLASISFLI